MNVHRRRVLCLHCKEKLTYKKSVSSHTGCATDNQLWLYARVCVCVSVRELALQCAQTAIYSQQEAMEAKHKKLLILETLIKHQIKVPLEWHSTPYWQKKKTMTALNGCVQRMWATWPLSAIMFAEGLLKPFMCNTKNSLKGSWRWWLGIKGN